MDIKDVLTYASAPFMAMASWVVSDAAKTKARITEVEKTAALLDVKVEAIKQTVDKIDNRQEDLIDFLLRQEKH